ncbi:MAG: hypothetical protein V3V20_05120 [Algisphaera sp.]
MPSLNVHALCPQNVEKTHNTPCVSVSEDRECSWGIEDDALWRASFLGSRVDETQGVKVHAAAYGLRVERSETQWIKLLAARTCFFKQIPFGDIVIELPTLTHVQAFLSALNLVHDVANWRVPEDQNFLTDPLFS